MSTLAQMRTNIANYLNRSDLSAEINLAINRAIEHYEKESFWFQETNGSFTTIANQQSYGTADGIPSTIKEIDLVKITLSSTNKPELIRWPFEKLQKIDVGAHTGQPYNYAWYQNKIWLYPTPNTAWSITVYYQKNYASLTVDADSNDWTTDAEDLIEARALWWIYKRILKDRESANDAAEDEILALKALQAKSNQLTGTGFIQSSSF